MTLIHTLPDWLIIAGILLVPLLWALIGQTISAANPERWRVVNKVALVMWLILLLYGAVFSRLDMGLAPAEWGLVPFRNYSAYTMKEVYLNIAMFEPIGMTLGVLLNTRKAFVSRHLTVMLIGLSLSLTIELLQQILVLGAFQVDDIIWNAIGCAIGSVFYRFHKLTM